MEKSTRNILIFLGVAVVIVGGYFTYQKYGKVSSVTDKKKQQFDDIVNSFNSFGADVFKGLSAEQYQKIYADFSKNFTDDDYKKLKNILNKVNVNGHSEAEKLKPLSPSEKIDFIGYLTKISGRKLGS